MSLQFSLCVPQPGLTYTGLGFWLRPGPREPLKELPRGRGSRESPGPAQRQFLRLSNSTYPHLPLIRLNYSDALLIFIYSLYISFGVSQVVVMVKNLPVDVGDARYMWFPSPGSRRPPGV